MWEVTGKQLSGDSDLLVGSLGPLLFLSPNSAGFVNVGFSLSFWRITVGLAFRGARARAPGKDFDRNSSPLLFLILRDCVAKSDSTTIGSVP